MRNQCPPHPPTRGMLLSFCEKGCYNMPLAISREFYLCFSYHSEAFLCLHVNVSMSFSFSVSISKSIVYFVLWTRNTAIFSLLGRWSINQKIMLIVGSFFLPFLFFFNKIFIIIIFLCVRARLCGQNGSIWISWPGLDFVCWASARHYIGAWLSGETSLLDPYSSEPKFHSYSSLLFLIVLILGTRSTCHKDLVKSNDFFVMAVISFAQIPAFCIYLEIRIVAIQYELGVPVEDIIYYKFFLWLILELL